MRPKSTQRVYARKRLSYAVFLFQKLSVESKGRSKEQVKEGSWGTGFRSAEASQMQALRVAVVTGEDGVALFCARLPQPYPGRRTCVLHSHPAVCDVSRAVGICWAWIRIS